MSEVTIDTGLRQQLLLTQDAFLMRYGASPERAFVTVEVPADFFNVLRNLETKTKLSRSAIVKALMFDGIERLGE